MTRYNTPANVALRGRGTVTMEPVPDRELTAIYCRKSMKGDKKEITVNRQKRLALDDCKILGLIVHQENIFIDNGASAWKRNRKRPGWDALIEKARRGEIRHIVMYHEDRGLRQPWDLEELLSISDEHGIMLYGRANARDLRDHNDRYALRIEIAHACRSSDDTSRRLKDQKQERAEDGLPMGARAYGYSKNGMKINPAEAAIVREIFDRFTKGETPHALAVDLSRRGTPTAKGKAWTESSIRRQLKNTHVAGIATHHGQEIGVGKWPAIITRQQWDFAQELLQFRSVAAQKKRDAKQPRTYMLRGLVVCGKCGTTMAGCSGNLYRCSRANRQDGMKCARTMQAEPLEKFVEAAAIRLLENLTVNPRPRRSAATDAAEREIDEDTQQLKDLHDMWISKEITTIEYRKDRREIQARINRNEKKLAVRVKSPEAIADLTGPDAKAKWGTLTGERKNAILRFLFRAVIIGARSDSVPFGSIDYGRIDIEPNDLG
jgi:site-specific DNA recombinase